MDNFHIPLSARKDTPSLCSNVTLWEMDDIEPSEPLLLPETASTKKFEGLSYQRPPESVPRVTFADTFVLPDRQMRPARRFGGQPAENSSGSQWPLGPQHQPMAQLHGVRVERRRFETQEYATDAFTSTRRDQRWGSSSSDFDLYTPPRVQPTEMSFMDCYPKGNATVSYTADNGETETITGITIEPFERRCPLLASAFETRKAGPHLHLENLTRTTAINFLRYLYTGSYTMVCHADGLYGDVPTSLLLHCQLYQLAAMYDIPNLMQQAYVNIIRQCEFGCSSPDPPIDLSAAIEYAYEHLRDHAKVLDTIVSYCVACFLRHRLAEDEDFKQIAYELKPFHQALCRESMNRKFENDTASAIIQMPFKQDVPQFYLSREDVTPSRMRDVVHHFHSTDSFDYSKDIRTPRGNTKMEQCEIARAEKAKLGKEGSASSGRALSALMSVLQSNETKGNVRPPPAKREAEDLLGSANNALLRDTDWSTTRLALPHRPSHHTGRQPSIDERANSDQDLELFGSMDDIMDISTDTDLDYELVSDPASVESLSSNSDRDSQSPEPPQSTLSGNALPLRTQDNVVIPSLRSGSCNNASESSDSEWSLL